MESDTLLVELPAEEASWIRVAINEKRDALSDDEDYDAAKTDAVLSSAGARLDRAMEGESIDTGLTTLLSLGLSPAEAVDYYMVELHGFFQSDWAERRDVGQQTVSENVNKAKKKLPDRDGE